MLDGYLIAYLNLDEVIRIIRYEDDPKAELMKRFSLTDVQAEAILNMRSARLRKLEEIEIRGEHDSYAGEKAELESLLASDEPPVAAHSAQITETEKRFEGTEVGKPPLQLRRHADDRHRSSNSR